jgi:hypothetical protein
MRKCINNSQLTVINASKGRFERTRTRRRTADLIDRQATTCAAVAKIGVATANTSAAAAKMKASDRVEEGRREVIVRAP